VKYAPCLGKGGVLHELGLARTLIAKAALTTLRTLVFSWRRARPILIASSRQRGRCSVWPRPPGRASKTSHSSSETRLTAIALGGRSPTVGSRRQESYTSEEGRGPAWDLVASSFAVLKAGQMPGEPDSGRSSLRATQTDVLSWVFPFRTWRSSGEVTRRGV